MIRDADIYEYLSDRGSTDRLVTRFVEPSPDWIELYRMDRGWIVAPLWIPVTDDGHVFLEFCATYARHKYAFCFEPAFEARLRSASGEPLRDAFVLGGEANHFHLLMDFLPRLYFLCAEGGIPARSVAIGADLSVAQRGIVQDILARAGVAAPQLVPLDTGVRRVENAFVPGNVTRATAVAIWTKHFYPARLRAGGGPARLFVLRNSGHRRLINQDAIAERLARLGFQCADPGRMSFDEQVRLFCSAGLIVGTHGAALTNLLFAPEGGHVFELCANVRQPHFRDIATARNITHTYVEGVPSPRGAGTQHDDFAVNPDALVGLLSPHLR